MITKVFDMTNVESPYVHWRQATLGLNVRMEYRSKMNIKGICAGMTAVWIKKSLASGGRGIKSPVELGSQHLMGIIHSAFSRNKGKSHDYGTVDLIAPLLESQNLVCWESFPGVVHRVNPCLITLWASLKPSHCLVVFGNKTTKTGTYNRDPL